MSAIVSNIVGEEPLYSQTWLITMTTLSLQIGLLLFPTLGTVATTLLSAAIERNPKTQKPKKHADSSEAYHLSQKS